MSYLVQLPRALLDGFVAALAVNLVASASAQLSTASLIPDYRNQLYYPAPASPEGVSLIPPASVALLSGHIGAPGAPTIPTSGRVKMLESRIGQSIGVPALPYLIPGIAWISPASGAAFADTVAIPLIARGWDLDDHVANVDFIATGPRAGTNRLLGAIVNEVPGTNEFVTHWRSSYWGTNSIVAVATDVRGQRATSAPVEIILTAVPQVWMVNPRPEEVFVEQSEVLLRAIAYDPDSSIDYVNFFANGVMIGRAFADTIAPNPLFEFVWTEAPLGSHSLFAEVHDRFGPSTLSAPTIILVGTTNTNSVTLVVSPPPVSLSALGTLQISLTPSNIPGQWRFDWESEWRDGGVTVNGLLGGEYPVVFKPVAGYDAPESFLAQVQAGTNNMFSLPYTASTLPQTGLLTIHIQPSTLAQDPDEERRAQWRRVGESGWHDSGDTNYWLPAGSYEIEFKRVGTFWNTPTNLAVVVLANAENSARAQYSVANRTAGTAPDVLSFEDIQNSYGNGLPFANCGQILSPIGWSSGSVIKPRVVLTVAHGLFDADRFSFVSPDEVRWFFQRHAGHYEPPPMNPRGWCVHSGYAAQRQADRDPGIASENSQRLDIAALYFLDPAGGTNNSRAGYLVSRPPDQLWLGRFLDATLVGYPVENIIATNRGRMHATPVQSVTFDHVSGPIYHTTQVKGHPGLSGGPLCVRYTNGTFYPAGIYLGGSTRTIIRSIDDTAIALIACADVLSNGDQQGTGGGPIRVRDCTNCNCGTLGFLNVIVLPPEMTNFGASYRFSRNITNVFQFDGYSNQFALGPKKTFGLEFSSDGPFVPPISRMVEVTNNCVTNTIVAQFRAWGQLTNRSTDALLLIGTTGSLYRVDSAPTLGLSNTVWTPLLTQRLSTPTIVLTNLVPRGTNQFLRAVLQTQ